MMMTPFYTMRNYAEKTIEKRWKCDLLVNAIKLEMHKHQPEANVSNNLPLLYRILRRHTPTRYSKIPIAWASLA